MSASSHAVLAAMTEAPLATHVPHVGARPVAVMDIGSNSIRLVVFDGTLRTPLPMYNEKITYGLGRKLQSTNRLDPDVWDEALNGIGRFAALAKAMDVGALHVLGTAALREAHDGPAFVQQVQTRFGVTIDVLSGAQEAALSALGVLCGTPHARGLVADLGGGSLELAHLGEDGLGQHVTLPLGVLRVAEATGGGARAKVTELMDIHLDTLPWVEAGNGRDLFVVGGAWRSVARICIDQTQHPLHVLDKFALDRDEALRLLDVIARMSKRSLEQVPSVSRRRLAYTPIAAVLLERILLRVKPARLVFSVFGMREGRFYEILDPEARKQDPLLGACLHWAQQDGRYALHGQELVAFTDPLFDDRDNWTRRRLREASCLLGDIFWDEHPDYRAEQAFLRTLRLPLAGLEHWERAEMALTALHRHQGAAHTRLLDIARDLMEEHEASHARRLGLAQRLGYAISGGAPGLLPKVKLEVGAEALTLVLPKDDPAYDATAYVRRLERLALDMGLKHAVETRSNS